MLTLSLTYACAKEVSKIPIISFWSVLFYNTQRTILKSNVEAILNEKNLNVVENLSVDLFLYGHNLLPPADNGKIISHVLDFIKNTNRLLT